jgi:hypothetical protein
MPKSPPPSRAAIRSQQDNPAKSTVIVAQPQTLRIHDCADRRLATSTGQTAVVTTQLTVKARWRDVGPVTGSGVAAGAPGTSGVQAIERQHWKSIASIGGLG